MGKVFFFSLKLKLFSCAATKQVAQGKLIGKKEIISRSHRAQFAHLLVVVVVVGASITGTTTALKNRACSMVCEQIVCEIREMLPWWIIVSVHTHTLHTHTDAHVEIGEAFVAWCPLEVRLGFAFFLLCFMSLFVARESSVFKLKKCLCACKWVR